MSLINISIFLCVLGTSNAYWKLNWNDEFDKEVLDLDNWEIDESDTNKCDGQKIGRLNCYTNSSRNIRLINGTVALTAIYENILNKKVSSAFIRTRKNFTYGKIEIRAALPIGKLLSPWVKLVPPKFKATDGIIRHNQLIVFNNDQSNNVKYGVSFPKTGKRLSTNMEDHRTNGGLNDFHIYSVEWNETDIIWKFDGTETNWINISGINTFLSEPVILTVYLRVGGPPFKNVALTLEDVYEWDCSLLILDCVKYYEWSQDLPQTKQTELKNSSSVGFCKNVMSEILPRKEPVTDPINLTPIISIICLIILLTLVPLIVWLVIKMKKIRKPEHRVDDLDTYYDDINQMEMYEEVDKDIQYEYVDPSNMSSKYNNYCSSSDQVHIRAVATNEQDNNYITMTSTKQPSKVYVKIEQDYETGS